MKIICCIRRTKLWAESYRHSDEWVDHWNADRVASLWDQTFTMTYVDFRRRLHQLQVENLRDVPFDEVINQYDYKGEEAIYVPTDDDDWFHPEVVERLRGMDFKQLYWNFISYTEGRVDTQNPAKQWYKVVFESNTYAIRNPETKTLLTDHTFANRTVRNSGVHLDGFLSVHNRTMASLSVMKEWLGRSPNSHAQLLALYDLSRKQPDLPPEVPEYFVRFIEKTLAVFRKELRVRKMFA